MACFARPDAPNPPVRCEDWPQGETVTLRPRMDWGIETQAQYQAFQMPEDLDVAGKSQAEVARIAQAHVDPTTFLLYKMVHMITAWTLRFDPTDEQRERGEEGDLAPLTPEMIAALPKAYADWIAAEIEKRGGALPSGQERGPEGDPTTARSALPSQESSSIVSAPSSNARSQRPASLKS